MPPRRPSPTRHPVASPPSRHAPSRPVGLVAGIVLAIAVAACGSSVAPSVAPSGAPTAAATPTPTPAPTVNTDDVLAKFEAFVAAQTTFRVVADIRMKVAGESLDMDVDLDVAGPDQQARMTIRGAGMSIRTDLVVVDGTTWIRIGNGDWATAPAAEAGSPNPLEGFALDGLVAQGPVTVAGQRLNHFQVNEPGAIDTTTITGSTLRDVVIDSALFDFYVTDEGVPVTATLAFSGQASVGAQRGPLEAQVRYDFSGFGEPIEIVAPA